MKTCVMASEGLSSPIVFVYLCIHSFVIPRAESDSCGVMCEEHARVQHSMFARDACQRPLAARQQQQFGTCWPLEALLTTQE